MILAGGRLKIKRHIDPYRPGRSFDAVKAPLVNYLLFIWNQELLAIYRKGVYFREQILGTGMKEPPDNEIGTVPVYEIGDWKTTILGDLSGEALNMANLLFGEKALIVPRICADMSLIQVDKDAMQVLRAQLKHAKILLVSAARLGRVGYMPEFANNYSLCSVLVQANVPEMYIWRPVDRKVELQAVPFMVNMTVEANALRQHHRELKLLRRVMRALSRRKYGHSQHERDTALQDLNDCLSWKLRRTYMMYKALCSAMSGDGMSSSSRHCGHRSRRGNRESSQGVVCTNRQY